jgi:hypothetical protein
MVSAAAFSGSRSGAPSKKSGGKKYLGKARPARLEFFCRKKPVTASWLQSARHWPTNDIAESILQHSALV